MGTETRLTVVASCARPADGLAYREDSYMVPIMEADPARWANWLDVTRLRVTAAKVELRATMTTASRCPAAHAATAATGALAFALAMLYSDRRPETPLPTPYRVRLAAARSPKEGTRQ